MDIGDYYSKSFNGFKNNPKLAIPTLVQYLIIYGLVFVLGLLLVLGVFGSELFSTGNLNASSMNYANLAGYFLLLYGVIVIIGLIITSYVSAATIGMSKSIINGEMPDLSVGIANGNRYFLKIIAVAIIMGLLLVVFALPGIFGIIIDRAYGFFPVLTIIGLLVSLILWLVTAVFFVFANQSIVVCENSVIGSLKDSFKLLRHNFVDVIVVLIINMVILLCIVVVLIFFNAFFNIVPILGAILGIILNIIVYSLINPYFTMVLTYLYMDKKDLMYLDTEFVD